MLPRERSPRSSAPLPSGSAAATRASTPSEFICTVHGLCFENRYRKLGELAEGDPLYLQREHGSRIDANAIRVMDPRVELLGCLPPEIARWLAPLIDGGSPTLARVRKVSRKDIPYYERLVIEVEVR